MVVSCRQQGRPLSECQWLRRGGFSGLCAAVFAGRQREALNVSQSGSGFGRAVALPSRLRTEGILMAPYPPIPARGDDVASARRGVLAYLLLVAVLSGAVQAVIIGGGQLDLVLLLMWMPGLASILVRLARR